MDPARLAAGPAPVGAGPAELVGGLTGRLGAVLLAEGVETAGELAACARLGVPLAQGWLLGRPTARFEPLAPRVADLVRGQVARARLAAGIAGRLRPLPQHPAGVAGAPPPPYVVVEDDGTPARLVLTDPRTGLPRTAPVSLQVPPSAGVAGTLRRALARPPGQRADPVLCTTRTGEVLGVLRVEDLAV